MSCDFKGGVCVRCGHAARHARHRRNCQPGLGDRVASTLSAVGITKDRAQAVAEAVGLEDCGCAERQRRLNEVGYRLGIGTPPPDNLPPAAQ